MGKLPLNYIDKNIIYNTLINNKNYVIGDCQLFNKHFPDIHYHSDCTEIYIIIDGEGEIYKDNKWVFTKKNDIHILLPNTYHCLKTEKYISIIYIFNKGPFQNIGYNYKKSKL